jgi:hypothetical protein
MPDIKLEETWGRLEAAADQIADSEVLLRRNGGRFAYACTRNGHDLSLWAVADSPRYCAQIDEVFSVRCTNITVLLILLRMACEHTGRWTGSEVWDPQ